MYQILCFCSYFKEPKISQYVHKMQRLSKLKSKWCETGTRWCHQVSQQVSSMTETETEVSLCVLWVTLCWMTQLSHDLRSPSDDLSEKYSHKQFAQYFLFHKSTLINNQVDNTEKEIAILLKAKKLLKMLPRVATEEVQHWLVFPF